LLRLVLLSRLQSLDRRRASFEGQFGGIPDQSQVGMNHLPLVQIGQR